MFHNAVLLPVDARVLFSLYDAYLTFYVAAACYEIDQISFGTDDDVADAAKVFNRVASLYVLKKVRFPDSLKSLVANVVSLLASFTDSAPTDPPEAVLKRIMARKRIVDEQLIWFGVTFNQTSNAAENIQLALSMLCMYAAPMNVSFYERASDFIANLYYVPPPQQPSLNQ